MIELVIVDRGRHPPPPPDINPIDGIAAVEFYFIYESMTCLQLIRREREGKPGLNIESIKTDNVIDRVR